MPKIEIIEKDLTTNPSINPMECVVYIAGLMGSDKKADFTKYGEPILCKTVAAFEDVFGATPQNFATSESEPPIYDAAFVSAHRLLELGLYVLYEVPSGLSSTSTIDDLKAKLLEEDFFDKLEDKGLYNIRYIYTAGYVTSEASGTRDEYIELSAEDLNDTVSSYEAVTIADATEFATLKATGNLYIKEGDVYTLVTTQEYDSNVDYCTGVHTSNVYETNKYYTKVLDEYVISTGAYDWTETYYEKESVELPEPVIKSIAKVVAKRGDCTYLLDCQESGYTLGNESSEILAEFESIVKTSDLYNTDFKYVAGFAPWCEFTYKVTDTQLLKYALPGSFAYLEAFANSINFYPQWNAAAGAVRGQVPDLVDTVIKFGELDVDILQSRLVNTIAVNPILNINPYGIIVWGNRTLHMTVDKDEYSKEDGLVASSFLNIRQLTNIIKKQIFKAARRLTFEQNTDILWVNFKALLEPMLDNMTGSGIRGYRILRGKSKRAELKAVLRIIPIEAVEDFTIDIELADSLEIVTE